jgi:hypothetical protein
MKYSGVLDFDDGDVIDVRSFILRDKTAPLELAFDIIANWDGQGRWQRNEVVWQRADGWFFSTYAPSIQVETGAQGILCKLSFRISDRDEESLSILGIWTEDNSDNRFSGVLELVL